MKLSSLPSLSKWPFILGDLVIIGIAFLVAVFAPKPYNAITASSIILCGTIGILIFFAPFVIEYISKLWVAKKSYEDTIEDQFDGLVKTAAEIDQVVQVLSGLATNHSFSAERIRDFDAQLEERLSRIESKVNTVADAFDQKIDRFLKRLEDNENDEVKNLVTEIGQMIERHSNLLGNKEDSSIEPEMIPDLLEPEGDSVPAETELSSVPEGAMDSIKNEDASVESDSELEFGEEEILQVDTESELLVPFKTLAVNASSLSLVAVVNVGIGNTLFVRGDGPGLSWTEGVPMKFLEIGKWEWSIDNADEPAVIQIFKNDEISAFGEEINVGLGERVEVHPKFPT